MSDLIDKEQALGCFWNYGYTDGTGYDETEMPAYYRLQALPPVAEVEDCISRQDAVDAIEFGITYAKAINKETGEVRELFAESNEELRKAVDRVKQLPPTQPQRKPGKTLAEEVERIKREIADIFAEQMSAQPQRIKGKWVRKESDLSWWYDCSKCGMPPLYNPYADEVLTSFCPWCGAEMEGE